MSATPGEGKLGVLSGLWSFYFVGGLIGIYMVPPRQWRTVLVVKIAVLALGDLKFQNSRFEESLLFVVGIPCIALSIYRAIYRPIYPSIVHLLSIYYLSICLSIYFIILSIYLF